ncbi:MAG: hypothetical protein OEZ06_04295 [Myxococcales bacterium]|nr:hypothetical protein [Myxococcales bacterium]
MKRWLAIGGGLLLLAWSPFLYTELTRERVEPKGRDLPAAAFDEDEPEPELEPADEEELEGEQEDEPAEPAEQAAAAEGEGEQAAEPEPAEAEQQVAVPEPAAEAESAAEGDEQAERPAAPDIRLSGPTGVLKQAFESETRDALWAQGAEAKLGQVLDFHDDEEMPQDFVQGTSCRRTVCRAELRWAREHNDSYVKIYQALGQQYGSEIGVEPVMEADEEDHYQVFLYVLRDGYSAADLAK